MILDTTINVEARMQYQRTTVETTVSPGKLLLMLYDGALRSLTQAQHAIAEKDIETAHTKIIKVQDIITELRATLNMDYPIAHNLASLYDFYHGYLVQANLGKNSEMLETVKEFLLTLRGAWQQAVEMTESVEASSSTVAPPAVKEMKKLNLMG
jgi:flagellar protein FliS